VELPHAARYGLTITAVLLAAIVAAPSAAAKPKPIPDASAFALPSTLQCVADRTLKLRLRKLRHVKWLGATIKVDGKRVKTVKRSQVTRPVTLTRLPRGRFALSITARANHHRRAKAKRTYHACAPQPGPKPAPQPAPQPTPQPPAGPPGAPGSEPTPPGSYSGSSSQGDSVSFYVAADNKHVQDVAVSLVGLSCTPGKTFDDQLAISEIAIGANGAFSASTSQDGVLFGAPAHFTYTFSGHFTGASATGTFRENIDYDNGTAFTCTSDTQTWSTRRDVQGAQTVSPAAPGTYSGSSSQGDSVSFYVSADHAHLQDVGVSLVGLGCTPGKTFDDQLAIGEIAIAASGAFSASTSQDGVLFGVPAHFTYTFSGHLHGLNSSGVARVGGTLREEITYNDGTAFDCTSNTQTWSTRRDTQGTGAAAPPPAGTYSGSSSQGDSVSFYVSADHAHLQDVGVSLVGLGCSPSKSFDDQLAIPDIVVAAGGTFSATTTEDGVLFGAPAHFSYTFSGHFHSPDSSGVARAAGTFRERITYNDGTAFDCTSNTQTWSTRRDTQGTGAAAPPPAGTYSGSSSQGDSLSFYVSADHAHLQDVGVSLVGLGCTPGKTFDDQLAIPDIAIAADGAFSATTTEDGVLFGAPAHFSYTFSGHFHGPNTAGVARAAGTFREHITYDDGTAFDCTSNTQTWSTTRTGP
jgi:hypothetical protein